MLRLERSLDSLSVHHGRQELLQYVYRAQDPQLESPRPYFHPLHTLGGKVVTQFRPDDHVWHRGIAWSLPNVGDANFWGGVTYRRDTGYVQLPNNGAMRHHEFLRLSPAAVAHRLQWVTEPGELWFREVRRFDIHVLPALSAWVLAFGTAMTNVSGREIVIGSPTTEGRENAGYGGLFWRAPESFAGGRVYAPWRFGHGDQFMGVRAPWLGYSGGGATLVFVDAPDNTKHPTQWFVRSTPFACLCPAPFFSTELALPDGESLLLRYAVVIADGDPGPDGALRLAGAGREALAGLETAPGELVGGHHGIRES